MAFGWEIGGVVGKLLYINYIPYCCCSGCIGYGLVHLIKHKYHRGPSSMCVALIFAGALGNIIDSALYGLLYQHGKLFEGRVVDMFHFPLINGTYPALVPAFGAGNHLNFSSRYLTWPMHPYQ